MSDSRITQFITALALVLSSKGVFVVIFLRVRFLKVIIISADLRYLFCSVFVIFWKERGHMHKLFLRRCNKTLAAVGSADLNRKIL